MLKLYNYLAEVSNLFLKSEAPVAALEVNTAIRNFVIAG